MVRVAFRLFGRDRKIFYLSRSKASDQEADRAYRRAWQRPLGPAHGRKSSADWLNSQRRLSRVDFGSRKVCLLFGNRDGSLSETIAIELFPLEKPAIIVDGQARGFIDHKLSADLSSGGGVCQASETPVFGRQHQLVTVVVAKNKDQGVHMYPFVRRRL